MRIAIRRTVVAMSAVLTNHLRALLAVALALCSFASADASAAAPSGVSRTAIGQNGNVARLFLTRQALDQLRQSAGMGRASPSASPAVPANTTTDMTYHGGPVMRNTVNYLVFWAPAGNTFAAGYQAGIERFFHDIGDTPFYNILSQYNDTSGVPVPNAASFGGSFTYTAAFPHAGTQADPLTDGDIQGAVAAAITANPGWVGPGINTMYFVFTPTGIQQCFNASNCFAEPGNPNGKYCAYHSMFGPAANPRIYAVEPFVADAGGSCTGQSTFPNGNAVDVTLSTVSHEMMEANTDPGAGSGIVSDGWYDSDGLSGEIGDKCAYNYGYVAPDGTNIVLNGNPYQVQQEWSNNTVRGCVKRFGDAPVTSIPGSLDFGTVPRGTSSVLDVPIQNAAGGDLNILNIRLGGGTNSAYSFVNVPPTTGTIFAGETLAASVKFSPPAGSSNSGPLTGSVIVDTDDPAQTTYTVALSGLVGLPKAALSGSLNFGLVCAGGSSDLQFTVTNTGTAPLTISSVSIGVGTPGLSVLSPPTLPQTLAIGASLTFTVRFTPAPGFTGAIVGTVNVSTDDPVNPTQSLPISGTVGAPVATIGASAIDFGGVATDNRTVPSTSDRTVTINNTGSCALKVTSASITAGGTDFSIVGAPTLPVTVGAGSSITLTIRFNPTAAGTRTGTLTVGTNDAANPSQAVSLTGLGLLPAIQLSPSAVVFPPTVILSQVPGYTGRTANLTVTNVGQAELIVDSMTTSGSPFSAVPATAPPARYATNDHYDEPVTFAPSAVGKFTGSFTVSDNNSEGGPISANAPLCGEGVGRGIRVLAVDGSGAPIQQLQRLHLQSHGTAVGVNVNLKNVSLVPVTTSCTAGEQRHYENQSLPATDTVNQQSSYYNLDVTAGGKATSITFTLGVSEFKTLIVTVK